MFEVSAANPPTETTYLRCGTTNRGSTSARALDEAYAGGCPRVASEDGSQGFPFGPGELAVVRCL